MENFVEYLTMIIILSVPYTVFKYCIYNLAEPLGMNKQLSLIPGYDIAVLFKYMQLPLWTLALCFIPVVNGIFGIYLLFKNPYSFFCLVPATTPMILFDEVEMIKSEEEKDTLYNAMRILLNIWKGFLYVVLGIIVLCGGFIILMLLKGCSSDDWDIFDYIGLSILLDELRFK